MKTKTTKPKRLKCGHCGWEYDPSAAIGSLVPLHDWPKPARRLCPGAAEKPRAVSDKRPLGKDES